MVELHILLCSVVLAALVVGGSPHSALPRYSHLHHFKQPPPITQPEPPAKESTVKITQTLKQPPPITQPEPPAKESTVKITQTKVQSQVGDDLQENVTTVELEHTSEDGGEDPGTSYNKTRLEELHAAYKRASEVELLRGPKVDDIVFQLFTRKSGLSYERLEADKPGSILQSSFDASKPTVAIIHGFMEDADICPWMKTIRDWFLNKEDMNVILVNWGELAHMLLNYYTAAKNARVVGEELGRLLGVIQAEHGISADSVYIIGFSLGAHAAGVAGQNFPGIGRITGLDPAGPEFEDKGINMRLDHTDAQFVDVIHTNYGELVNLHFGYKKNLGHVDHYVNGGRNQPGCQPIAEDAIIKFFNGDMRDFHPCNHERSYLYYIESLHSGLPAAGFQCPSYSKFSKGGCLRNDANVFGLGVKASRPGVYYLDTQADAPYLSRHLEVTITVGDVEKTTTGSLYMMAFMLDRTTFMQKLVRSHNFKTGEELKTMLVLPQDLPLSAVPTQLKFDKTGLYFFRPKTLDIAKLQIVEAELDFRSYQACNTTLYSPKFWTVSLTTEQCGQQALY